VLKLTKKGVAAELSTAFRVRLTYFFDCVLCELIDPTYRPLSIMVLSDHFCPKIWQNGALKFDRRGF